MSKRTLIVGAIVMAALIVLLGMLLLVRGAGRPQPLDNRLLLARTYLLSGEYERSLDLVDSVLLEMPNHPMADSLRQIILAAKRGELLPEHVARRLQQLFDDDDALLDDLEIAGERAGVDAPTEADGSQSAVRTEGPPAPARTTSRRSDGGGRSQVEGQQPAAALDTRQQALVEQIETALQRGLQLMDDQQYRQARATFQDVLKIELADKNEHDRYHSIAMARLAEAHRREKGSEALLEAQAGQMARQALQLYPDNWEAYYTLGQLHLTDGNHEQAIEHLERATDLQSESAAAWYALGNARYRVGRYSAARQAYERCVALEFHYPNGYHNLGITDLQLGDTRSAQQSFRNAIQVDATDSRAYYHSGSILLDENNVQEALPLLARSVALAPQSARYRSRLGRAYFVQQRYKEADEHFSAATRLAPQQAAHNYNNALSRYELDNFSSALDFATTAIQLDDSVAAYHYTQGQAYDALGERQQARQSFTNALQRDKRYVKAMGELGRLLYEDGQIDQGLVLLQTAYGIQPDLLEVNNNLGNIYLNQERYPDSIRHYRRAIDQQATDLRLRYHLSLAYIGAQLFDEAQQELLGLVSVDNNYWPAYHRLGEVFIAQGNTEGARDVLERLIERNPQYSERDRVEQILVGL